MAKNSQMKMEIPIPLALSRLKIAESIAKEVKMMERKIPIIISENPVSIDEYSKIGIPQPIKNAKIKAPESPIKMLNQILVLGTG